MKETRGGKATSKFLIIPWHSSIATKQQRSRHPTGCLTLHQETPRTAAVAPAESHLSFHPLPFHWQCRRNVKTDSITSRGPSAGRQRVCLTEGTASTGHLKWSPQEPVSNVEKSIVTPLRYPLTALLATKQGGSSVGQRRRSNGFTTPPLPPEGLPPPNQPHRRCWGEITMETHVSPKDLTRRPLLPY